MEEIALPQHAPPLAYNRDSRLPSLQECHNATVRYIRAGYYLDAILSVIDGLAKCRVPFEMNINRTKTLLNIAGSISEDILIDRVPMDPPRIVGRGREASEEVLTLAMIYNLALSYHLYALSITQQEIDLDTGHMGVHTIQQFQSQVPAICSDSLYLYQESQSRLLNLHHPITIETSSISLENNMRHVSMLHQRQSQ